MKAANKAAAGALTVTQDRLKAQEHLEQARERPATALDAKITRATDKRFASIPAT